MAEGVYTGAMCKKLSGDADKGLNTLDQGKSGVRDKMNGVRDQLKAMSWSPASQVSDAMNEINNQADKMVPDLSDLDEIYNFLNACNYFSINVPENPAAAVASAAQAMKDQATDLMQSIAGALPEFDAAKLYDSALSHLKAIGVPAMADAIKKALACLDATCGTDTSGQYRRLDNALKDMELNGDGTMPDSTEMLAKAGITDPTKIESFGKSVDTTQKIYGDIDTKVGESVNMIKSAGSLASSFTGIG